MADENTNTAETAASTNAPETGVNAQPKDTCHFSCSRRYRDSKEWCG